MVADLAWDIQLSATQVWQHEQITLEVTVPTSDPFARLKADKVVIPSMEVITLPARRETTKTGQEQLRLRWQLYPHTSGKQTIQLPVIRYYLNGGTRQKWLPPLQTIEVQALPPYLPPTLPVGSVAISSHIEPSGILRPDSLAYWHISLHSTTVPTTQFPALLKQLKASSDLDVLPAKISVKSDTATGEFRLNYRIPLKPKTSGRLALPDLQWHWFDPKTARLEQMHYEPSRSWVLAFWQQILLLLSSGILLLAGAYPLIKRGLIYYRHWRSKQQVLRQLRTDTLSYEVMKACAKTHGWADNFSLQQWLDAWQQCYGENQLLQDAVLAYEKRRFGNVDPPAIPAHAIERTT